MGSMSETRRERRIRDRLRMKAKAARIYPHDPKRRHADNLAVCSCHMCCNPRRNDFLGRRDKLTIQEQRHLQDGHFRSTFSSISSF